MYPFGFIHMLPPHILVSCQVGQYLPLVCNAGSKLDTSTLDTTALFLQPSLPQTTNKFDAQCSLRPWAQSGNSFGVGDLVPVVSTRTISVISSQLWTDHDGSWWIIRITNEICEICICCASCALIAPKGICSAENLKILNDRLNICRVSLLELGHPATGSQRRRPAQMQMDWFKGRKLKGFRM